MVIDGYLLIIFKITGMSVIGIKLNNLYQPIFFREKTHADKIMERLKNTNKPVNGLTTYKTKAYVGNKLIYEDNKELIDSTNIECFNTI